MTKKLLSIVICSALISGCAIKRINDIQDSAINKSARADELIRQISEGKPVVEFSNSQYINTKPLAVPKYNAPPEIVRCKIFYKPLAPQDLYQFGQDVTDQCRVRTRIAPDAANYLSQGAGSAGTVTQRLTSVPAPVPAVSPEAMRPLDSFGAMPSSAGQGTGGVVRKISDISYSGGLPALLDMVTSRLGLSWKYENNNITFYYLETRRFDIEPADAKYTLNGTVTSGVSTAAGAGDSGGAGGGQEEEVVVLQARGDQQPAPKFQWATTFIRI